MIFLWLLLVVIVFWSTQIRPIQVFDENNLLMLYDTRQQKNILVKEVIGLVQSETLSSELAIIHFNKPGCTCNEITKSHIRDINKNQQENSYHSYFITSNQSVKERVSEDYFSDNVDAQKSIVLLDSLSSLDWLPALPAVMILDKGKLAYLGPYSSGTFCGSSNSYIEPVLDMINNKNTPSILNGVDFGCYCKNN